MYKIEIKILVFIPLFLVLVTGKVLAETVEYDLTVSLEDVNVTGKKVEAMVINGGIPGPILRFKEGGLARIHVHNTMNVDTSIHWHGLLVPPDMDGVPYVTFPPIKPHSTFTYEFPIRQSGTYWYHSHTRLQEQRGVYGAFVIEEKGNDLSYDREYTVVLSDWTNENPHEVLRTLKRGGHWFAIQKGSAQSIIGAAKSGMLKDYFKRELQRMPVMDIADIAYDNFLANGKPEIFLDAQPGETVRLRIIDGSSTTFFHLNFAGGPMAIVSADGLRVEPVKLDRFLIAVAETYDILVTISDEGMYELRSTAHDASGFSSIWIGSGKRHVASSVPPPNMYESMGKLSLKKVFALTPAGSMGMWDSMVEAGKFDNPGMMGGMMEMNGMQGVKHMSAMSAMHHSDMKSDTMDSYSMNRQKKRFSYNFIPMAPDISSRKGLVMDGMEDRPWPPYKKLRSIKKTAFSKDLPVREIRLTLDGDMERYVWFINNKPLSAQDTIHVRANEITRFILINRTMMHHPMHLHGQFFRVINGQGDYAPLKHTVNAAPMSTTVFEIDGSETGDWFLHCHLLYHMKSGMARVVHYEDFTPQPEVQVVRKNLYKEDWYVWAQTEALSNMNDGSITVSDTRNIFEIKWEVGWKDVEATEWEGIVTYERYINRFLTLFAGGGFEGEEDTAEKGVGIFGLHYILPLNVESGVWIDTDGEWRFMLERELALTPRLELFGETEYDTLEKWECKAGLSYRINKNISVVGQWHSEYGWGGGGKIEF